jgi:hypothetical protein
LALAYGVQQQQQQQQLFEVAQHKKFQYQSSRVLYQRGLTEEMPENVHFCIQKAATHSHFIPSTPF